MKHHKFWYGAIVTKRTSMQEKIDGFKGSSLFLTDAKNNNIEEATEFSLFDVLVKLGPSGWEFDQIISTPENTSYLFKLEELVVVD